MSSSQPAGGFINEPILSPPPSSVATSSVTGSTLPKPRQHPLKSGGTKESSFINYVDHGILQVQRRYAKKFEDSAARDEDAKGYTSFKEVAKDIERLVDVVWVSGTPSLQIPYLLTLALLVVTYLPSFPPAPRTTFRLLQKLDLAFASLIEGKDADTGDALPGMETSAKRGVSGTQKVRIKGIVERTRVAVVELMNAGDFEEERDSDAEGEEDSGVDGDYDASMGFEMEVARVYYRTMLELGDVLGGDGIGIPDEPEQ